VNRPVALALRALGLGDFVTGVPALNLLRRALPGHRLMLAAPARLAPLVTLVPAVDGLLPHGELEALTGVRGPIEVAVDLHGKGWRSRQLLLDLHPCRVVGFADPSAGLPGPEWRRDEHEVARWLRLIVEGFRVSGNASGPDAASAPAGSKLAGSMLAGSMPAGSMLAGSMLAGSMARPAVPTPAGLTVIHPGAAAAARRWPVERFATVARSLISRGHRVVLTGTRAEAELVGRVSAGSGAPPLLDLPLLDLTATIAGARLLICGDTGVAHLASAYRVPSVVLFGPVSPREWGPPPDPRHQVLWHGDGTGDPHAGVIDPALLEISIPEVLAAVERIGGSG